VPDIYEQLLTVFLHDGRVCLTNMYSLIATAKMNDVDPPAWLADVLARINDLPQNRLHELLPWEWAIRQPQTPAA
jgi:hypothetical protein